MKLTGDDRTKMMQLNNLFQQATMRKVFAHFMKVYAERSAILTSERDEKHVRIGAGTDALRMDPMWYLPWKEIDFHKIDLVRPYTWLLFPVALRNISKPSQLVPWHQDCGYQHLAGGRGNARLITCYAPVDPDPEGRSTIELAVGDFPQLTHFSDGDHGACLSDPPGERVSFELKSGDAIIFGDFVPHRTIVGQNGTIDRRSFEYRLIRPEDAQDDRDYYDIEKKIFVRTDGTERDWP